MNMARMGDNRFTVITTVDAWNVVKVDPPLVKRMLEYCITALIPLNWPKVRSKIPTRVAFLYIGSVRTSQ